MIESVPPWPLVGRAAELSTMRRALAGPAPVVLDISGDGGVGKTRLLEEAAASADGDGAAATWVRANQSAAVLPYAATAHLLPTGDGSSEVVDLFRHVQRQLSRSGRRSLLAIDDAHLLDRSSATLIRWLFEHAGTAIALTRRHGQPCPGAVERLLREPTAVVVRLSGLTRDDTHALLTAGLGGPVDGITFEHLWTATDGNPLFLRELVASGLAAGALTRTTGVWQWQRAVRDRRGLEQVVDERLAGLTPQQCEVIELVACGEPLAIDILEAVADPAAVATVEASGLLVGADEESSARVRLVHPMFAEAIQRGLPILRGRQLRRRLGAALVARGAHDADELLRLAGWALAAELELEPTTMVAAARRAIDLVELELAERLARSAVESGAGWDAVHTQAEALRRQHRVAEAEAVLRDAEATSSTDAERARSLVTRAENLYWGRTAPEAAESVLADGEAASGQAGDQLLALQAMLWMFEGRPADALRLAEDLLTTDPSDDVTRWTLSTAAFCANAVGRPSHTLELTARGLASLTGAADASWKDPQFRWARCQARLALGEMTEAARDANDGYVAAVQDGAALRAGGWMVVRGLVARQQGKLATATNHLREAVTLLGDMDPYRLVSLALAQLGVTLAQRGFVDDAAAALDDADARRGGARMVEGIVDLGRAWCRARLGDPDGAATDALGVAQRATCAGNRWDALVAAHDAAVLGSPQAASEALGQLQAAFEGPWPELYLAHANALADSDPRALLDVAERSVAAGALSLAAGAAGRAADAFEAQGRA
ncbi:MAG: AAA family ATPase, partial [Acidimicrobiales bacterium]